MSLGLWSDPTYRKDGKSVMLSEEKCTNCLAELPLAYTYTPMQEFDTVYDNDTALSKGTVFPELYKPKSVYGKDFKPCEAELGCDA